VSHADRCMRFVQGKGQSQNQETVNVGHSVVITALALQEESSHTQAWWQTGATYPPTHTSGNHPGATPSLGIVCTPCGVHTTLPKPNTPTKKHSHAPKQVTGGGQSAQSAPCRPFWLNCQNHRGSSLHCMMQLAGASLLIKTSFPSQLPGNSNSLLSLQESHHKHPWSVGGRHFPTSCWRSQPQSCHAFSVPMSHKPHQSTTIMLAEQSAGSADTLPTSCWR
jgi:hypothetical protein